MHFAVSNTGSIQTLNFDNFSVPFRTDEYATHLTIVDGDEKRIDLHKDNQKYVATQDGITYAICYAQQGEALRLDVTVRNQTDKPFAPEKLLLCLGIDNYMESTPLWNDIGFPSFFRVEKEHFYGYFMTPQKKLIGIACNGPIPSYHYVFNRIGIYFGHRIYTTELSLINNEKLPERYPLITHIAPGQSLQRSIFLAPIDSLDTFEMQISQYMDAPVFRVNRTAYAVGEQVKIELYSHDNGDIAICSPCGARTTCTDTFVLTEVGEYILTATNQNGKTATLRIRAFDSFGRVLNQARAAAFQYPQKATTHAESYYGFYSAFLAAKHFPQQEIDEKLLAHFQEVMPLMFDFATGRPRVCTERIQNASTFLGILADLYESDPQKHLWALDLGQKVADFLMNKQFEDGSYRCENIHYTCVIYIAKSMLEFAQAEQKAGGKYAETSKIHYASAKRATDDLVRRLENIDTEGELTLEDGMISCSALQIGAMAFTLEGQERDKYVQAMEHMLSLHRCLEYRKVPDYRINGASLRFWEAQYDVMLYYNFMNSPHGWSGWTGYALYYAYLLTGKEHYLISFLNNMGACVSLMQDDGKLNWAFMVDPQITAKGCFPDRSVTVEDAYKNVPETPAYGAKYEVTTRGECYIPMISDWYRTSKEQNITGGYATCPLILPDTGEWVWVNNQGGACDNDVHEVFKCMEECLYQKAFLISDEQGIRTLFAVCDGQAVILNKEIKYLHCNIQKPCVVNIRGKQLTLELGNYFVNLAE